MLAMIEAAQALPNIANTNFFFRLADHGRCGEPQFWVSKIELSRANLIQLQAATSGRRVYQIDR